MVRTWTNAIYNRTYEDIRALQYNPDQDNPKGCWNASDLNRIEQNTAYVAEYMLENKIVRTPPSITVYENDYWEDDMIPTQTEITRILSNVRYLVELSSNNPAIADELPDIYIATQMNYTLANQVEYALELMHNQPKLPLEYFTVELTHGIITTIVRENGITEVINSNTALVAEEEIVTIQGTGYGEYAQYQTFTYWSGSVDDVGLLDSYTSQQTSFTMPYGRNISLTGNFETHIPRTLTLTNGYISVNNDPTAETGPTSGTYYAGDQIMIIADIATTGKTFREWSGTAEALEQIVGITENEDPSTAILTMPDCDVNLTAIYINAGKHYVTVTNGTGSGWYDYDESVSISASVPSHYGFDNWSGDTSYLDNIYSEYQSFRMRDVNVNLRANYSYRYSYNSVQIINGLITVNGTNVTQANNLRQTTTYTLVPQPPTGQGLYNWTIEGEGSMNYDSLGNCGNTFTVGDGNAIITANYTPLRNLTITNLDNESQNTTYSLAQGRKQQFITQQTVGSYIFNGWYENNTRISTSTTLQITMGDSDRTIEARYDYHPSYTVTVVNRNNLGQTTTSQVTGGTYWVSVTNEEVGDYLFVGWYVDGTLVTNSTSCVIGVSRDFTVNCVYRPKETYTLTVNNGSGSGSYKERQSVTITANTPASNKIFSGWNASGVRSIANSNASSTTIQMGRQNATCTANYISLRSIVVTTNSGTNTYTVAEGRSQSINANPAPSNWEFSHWEIVSGDVTISNYLNASTSITAHTSDSEVQAVYTAIPYFTVTMENGYIWDGSDWVASATLIRNSTNAIKMKPAPTGYQFLQWEVYENGVLQTNANDVSSPLAETTTLRNLTRSITIKATYYMPDPEVTYTLTIERKDGSVEQNDYTAGQDIQISASSPDTGYEFYKWTGDTAYVAGGIYNANSYIHMPAQSVYVKENFVLEGYIPEFDVEMTNIYGECCYETTYEDPETHHITTTEHWVSRYSYPEGTRVKIRATGFSDDYYFDSWSAINHSTEADARSIITNLSSAQTTLVVPSYDVDVEPNIVLKPKYRLTVNDGGTTGDYYGGAKADIYFGKEDTENIHYEFIRWIGTTVSQLVLWEGGMFDVTTAGDVQNPQFIKMPERATEVTATYRTLYKITLTNGVIDSTSTSQGFYESGTQLNITANTAPTGMKFQYWAGDVSRVGSIYDPTTTIMTTNGVTNIRAVYSTDADRNSIGYTTIDLKSSNAIDTSNINVISGEIDTGFIITDSNGHIYIITQLSGTTATIYRLTKIDEGGNVYD